MVIKIIIMNGNTFQNGVAISGLHFVKLSAYMVASAKAWVPPVAGYAWYRDDRAFG
jgi:hypothetical protein